MNIINMRYLHEALMFPILIFSVIVISGCVNDTSEMDDIIFEKLIEKDKAPAEVEEAYRQIFNYRIYYYQQDIEKTLKVDGNTKEERWQQVIDELVRGYPRANIETFPKQNEGQLDLDYQWRSHTEPPFFLIYWTDSETKERYQKTSGGIVSKVD